MDFLHSISIWLETFLSSIADNFWLSMFVIFLVAMGECVFILGLFVPSTPVLLLLGGLIADGRLPFWPLYLITVFGAIVGDFASYSIGHALKDHLKGMWPFNRHVDLIERGERFFAVHGGKSVFIGRFIPGVKAVVPGIAGMMGMDWHRFVLINVLSSFVWAAAHILPGMLLTAWLKSIGLSLELVIVFGTLILAALFFTVHYHRRILLFLAPWLGGLGRNIQARWGRADGDLRH